MKTAISLDGKLLVEADRAAREIGISRSRLFSLALEDYLEERRNAGILEQLNRVYAGGLDTAVRRTAAKLKARFRQTNRERW